MSEVENFLNASTDEECQLSKVMMAAAYSLPVAELPIENIVRDGKILARRRWITTVVVLTSVGFVWLIARARRQQPQL
ncbi:hypothetical protein OG604_22905 [Streptomyces sp. NBC_01231]|nr:hypothetical protein OG604_22905 [Streptomyces sp. NBC_01231]